MELYSKTSGSVGVKVHSAFLNMWLEHFIFCGRSVGPAIDYQCRAEHLAGGNNFPLGKHLLGSVYSLLHELSIRLRNYRSIGIWVDLGGYKPLAQCTLILNMNVFQQRFPTDQTDAEEVVDRRCMSFGKVTATFPGDRLPSSDTAEFIRGFYNGLKEESMSWYVYEDKDHFFELPFKF